MWNVLPTRIHGKRRKCLQVLHAHIENDHIDPTLSTVIRLAVDGMYFNQLHGINLSLRCS
ncbi:hypothetical protein [Sporomusa sp.]|uniref:hypothetical protein n=1 Tax=Sporomusa sp. TaxID=2078658 RepID=UPI0039C8FF7A